MSQLSGDQKTARTFQAPDLWAHGPTLATLSGKLPGPVLDKLREFTESRKATQSQPGFPECIPTTDGDWDGFKSEKRYRERSCDEDTGMWAGESTVPIRHNKYMSMAKILNLGPGSRVLDWGTGCGVEMHRIAEEFKFTGIGIDVVAKNVAWANKKFTQGKHARFCLKAPASLPFAANQFDAVISNAAFFYLGPGDVRKQKAGLRQILQVLRPGGCAWLGGLGIDEDKATPPTAWDAVGKELASIAVLGTVKEKAIFPQTEYDWDGFALVACKTAEMSET